MKKFVVVVILLAGWLMQVSAQTVADPSLLAEISKIKAIDNHAHPLKYVAAGEKADDEYDALPLEAIEAFPLPLRLSPTNPEFIRAWHDLYGYAYSDMSEAHVAELLKTKQRVMLERGDKFPAWINLNEQKWVILAARRGPRFGSDSEPRPESRQWGGETPSLNLSATEGQPTGSCPGRSPLNLSQGIPCCERNKGITPGVTDLVQHRVHGFGYSIDRVTGNVFPDGRAVDIASRTLRSMSKFFSTCKNIVGYRDRSLHTESITELRMFQHGPDDRSSNSVTIKADFEPYA